MPSIRIFAVVGAVAGLAAGPAGSVAAETAGAASTGERYESTASSQVLDLALLGRRAGFGAAHSESRTDGGASLAQAIGLGATVLADSRSISSLDDPAAPGGKRCALPPGATSDAQGQTSGPVEALGPGVELGLVCGEARASRQPEGFLAEGNGRSSLLIVGMPLAFRDAVARVIAAVDPALQSVPLPGLAARGEEAARMATHAIEGLLGTVVPGVRLTQLPARLTVQDLLGSLAGGELLRVTLGGAMARTTRDPHSYVSEAAGEGAVVEVLPGLGGRGQPPLLRIAVAASGAGITFDRVALRATARVTNPVVRVQSEVLGALSVAGLPAGAGPVEIGRLLAAATGPGGLRSEPGSAELAPGQGISILCQGPVTPLCSEVSISPPRDPVTLPDGGMAVEASTVSVHLFKSRDCCTEALATAVWGAVNEVGSPALAAGAVATGEAATEPGVQLIMAAARAEAKLTGTPLSPGQVAAGGVAGQPAAGTGAGGGAGGATPAVSPANQVAGTAATLPRTGGGPGLAPALGLAGAGLGLHRLARRHRLPIAGS